MDARWHGATPGGEPTRRMTPEEIIARNPLAGYPDGFAGDGPSVAPPLRPPSPPPPAIAAVSPAAVASSGVRHALDPADFPSPISRWGFWFWLLEQLDKWEYEQFAAMYTKSSWENWPDKSTEEAAAKISASFSDKREAVLALMMILMPLIEMYPGGSPENSSQAFVRCEMHTVEWIESVRVWVTSRALLEMMSKAGEGATPDEKARAEQEYKDKKADIARIVRAAKEVEAERFTKKHKGR